MSQISADEAGRGPLLVVHNPPLPEGAAGGAGDGWDDDGITIPICFVVGAVRIVSCSSTLRHRFLLQMRTRRRAPAPAFPSPVRPFLGRLLPCRRSCLLRLAGLELALSCGALLWSCRLLLAAHAQLACLLPSCWPASSSVVFQALLPVVDAGALRVDACAVSLSRLLSRVLLEHANLRVRQLFDFLRCAPCGTSATP